MTVFSRCAGSCVGFAREIPMCEPPRKWMRLTLFDGQRRHVLDVALHQPLEPVADADDVDAFQLRADGRRADHAVDPGRGAARDEDAHVLVMSDRH